MSFFRAVTWSASLSLLLDRSLSSPRRGGSVCIARTSFLRSRNSAMVEAAFLSVFVFLNESLAKFAIKRGLMMATRYPFAVR
jgi:hypothetical protein